MDNYNDQTRPLEPGMFYHIYNRGNRGIPLFYTDENYRYFLMKYKKYLSPYVDTFAYCLLYNHFHFFIRIKQNNSIHHAKVNGEKYSALDLNIPPNFIVSEQFRILFLSYAKAVNKREQLKGSLFQKVFRRRHVDDDLYYTRLMYYIHSNPVHHGRTTDFTSYQWSSYLPILKGSSDVLCHTEILSLFGGKNEYIDFHQRDSNVKLIDHLLIEQE
jgi:putative transposase